MTINRKPLTFTEALYTQEKSKRARKIRALILFCLLSITKYHSLEEFDLLNLFSEHTETLKCPTQEFSVSEHMLITGLINYEPELPRVMLEVALIN